MDDDKCAYRMKGNGHNPYALVDCEPAKEITLWRMKVLLDS